uniref:Uncharacterized protein n=1 Tax=Solanum lycopersicum TaxID=4081 RepID=A0A3Q7ECK9_SOLLC
MTLEIFSLFSTVKTASMALCYGKVWMFRRSNTGKRTGDFQVSHVLRERNHLANLLTNRVFDCAGSIKYISFHEPPSKDSKTKNSKNSSLGDKRKGRRLKGQKKYMDRQIPAAEKEQHTPLLLIDSFLVLGSLSRLEKILDSHTTTRRGKEKEGDSATNETAALGLDDNVENPGKDNKMGKQWASLFLKEGDMIVQLQKDDIPKATEKLKKVMILYVVDTEPTIASLERFIASQWNLHE